jgi:hypothetical protein
MFQQYTVRATRISLVALMTLQFALSGLMMAPSAPAQQPAGQQVFVPPAIKAVDHNELGAMATHGQWSPQEKMSLLKSMPSVSPLISAPNVLQPFLRLTPRYSFVSKPGTVEAYWSFNQVVYFTPRWWDDEGVALFEGPLEFGSQMVLRFSGQPNQKYAVDVTLGIGLAGEKGTNTYRVVCVVDGTPLPAKKFEFKTAPRRHEHLLFDLAPSTSGEYMVTISMIPNTKPDEPHSWWYFSSLEVNEAVMVP